MALKNLLHICHQQDVYKRQEEEWFEKINLLIESKILRESIGEQAYQEVLKEHVTQNTGENIVSFFSAFI